MRSGLVIIPDGMSLEALKGEAEFYLVTNFLTKLQELEEQQRRLTEEQQQCQHDKSMLHTCIIIDTGNIHLIDKGCYVNESRGEAFLFYPNGKLTCVRIPEYLRQQFSAYDQAMVSPSH